MEKGIRKTLISLIAFIALILGLFFSTFLIPRPLTDSEIKDIGLFLFDSPRQISEFQMIDEHGKKVGKESLYDQWSVIFFSFTSCPDICPTTLSVISKAYENFDKPVKIIMVTVDPERDSSERLAKYLSSFNSEFVGYRGSFRETVNLSQQLNIAFGKIPGNEPGTYTVDHSASLVLIDNLGRYMGFIKPPHSPSKIQRAINSL